MGILDFLTGSNSNSDSRTINNTSVTNIDVINEINKTLNETLINVMQSHSNNCSASSMAMQTQHIGVLRADGPGSKINGTINQSNQSTINFNCLIKNDITNDYSQKAQQALKTMLNNNYDVKSKADLASGSSASNQTSGLVVPGSAANSNSSSGSTNNTNILNLTNRQLNNTIQNSFSENVTQQVINDCVTQMSKVQSLELEGAVATRGGEITFDSSQTMIETINSTCKQLNTSLDKIANDIVNSAEYSFQTKSSDDLTTKSTSNSSSTAVSKGIDLVKLFNPVAAIAGAVLGEDPGKSGTSLISGACCCCSSIIIIIVAIIALYVYLQGATPMPMIAAASSFL